jgi:hypothetical protein
MLESTKLPRIPVQLDDGALGSWTIGLIVQQLEGGADVGLPPIPSRLHMLLMENGCVGGDEEDGLC